MTHMGKDDVKPTSVRLPPDIREALAVRARSNRRSISQEVCVAIEHYLANTPEPSAPRLSKPRKS